MQALPNSILSNINNYILNDLIEDKNFNGNIDFKNNAIMNELNDLIQNNKLYSQLFWKEKVNSISKRVVIFDNPISYLKWNELNIEFPNKKANTNRAFISSLHKSYYPIKYPRIIISDSVINEGAIPYFIYSFLNDKNPKKNRIILETKDDVVEIRHNKDVRILKEIPKIDNDMYIISNIIPKKNNKNILYITDDIKEFNISSEIFQLLVMDKKEIYNYVSFKEYTKYEGSFGKMFINTYLDINNKILKNIKLLQEKNINSEELENISKTLTNNIEIVNSDLKNGMTHYKVFESIINMNENIKNIRYHPLSKIQSAMTEVVDNQLANKNITEKNNSTHATNTVHSFKELMNLPEEMYKTIKTIKCIY